MFPFPCLIGLSTEQRIQMLPGCGLLFQTAARVGVWQLYLTGRIAIRRVAPQHTVCLMMLARLAVPLGCLKVFAQVLAQTPTMVGRAPSLFVLSAAWAAAVWIGSVMLLIWAAWAPHGPAGCAIGLGCVA